MCVALCRCLAFVLFWNCLRLLWIDAVPKDMMLAELGSSRSLPASWGVVSTSLHWWGGGWESLWRDAWLVPRISSWNWPLTLTETVFGGKETGFVCGYRTHTSLMCLTTLKALGHTPTYSFYFIFTSKSRCTFVRTSLCGPCNQKGLKKKTLKAVNPMLNRLTVYSGEIKRAN